MFVMNILIHYPASLFPHVLSYSFWFACRQKKHSRSEKSISICLVSQRVVIFLGESNTSFCYLVQLYFGMQLT